MGGTIDALPYPEDESQYPADSESMIGSSSVDVLREMASQFPPCPVIDWVQICNKDSKYIDDTDIKLLFKNTKANEERYGRIVITVGTDRMVETLKKFTTRMVRKPKCPVVFTGAIWPLSNGKRSDGRKNLRQAAFSHADIFPDFYISMGDIFAPGIVVRKNFKKKEFYIEDLDLGSEIT